MNSVLQNITDMDTQETLLMKYIQSYEWVKVLHHVALYPKEAAIRGPQGRTALHVACVHDAPAVVVGSLLAAYPEASTMVGTSNMNPLHLTCSSNNASVHVVYTLLQGSPTGKETSMRDIDGDTPLHAACRCGAPIEVLEVLLRANPDVVNLRDCEGLTPLLRLWVRCYVILGSDYIDNISSPQDLQSETELNEAWQKTLLLLRTAYHGHLHFPLQFRAVNAAAAIDCPRAVLKIAMMMYPEELTQKDEQGRTPLIIAATAPIYKVHDLSADGFNYDELDLYNEENEESSNTEEMTGNESNTNHSDINSYEDDSTPSVIEVILQACPPLASIPDSSGVSPLHIALQHHKKWKQGVQNIFEANPISLYDQDSKSALYPFMLAAVGPKSCVGTIYELLRESPDMIKNHSSFNNGVESSNLTQHRERRKSSDCGSFDEEKCSRSKIRRIS